MTDSSLLPILLAMAFFTGICWVFTKNLDSKDTLALLSGVGTLKGFAWLGWIMAFLEIPVAVWSIKRMKNLNFGENERLKSENARVRKHLRQVDLDLEFNEQLNSKEEEK